ncbi:PREDICTED: sodium/potassium-transporting ATPase subunit beta-like [Rhagoletis zephyria]|uniref:sodium/potassium-transporting ATPase subunit beta-like n=1 Tax=Rhagoletis zephyria TaxID=28612 RepID=UPI00081131FA|nr:PREDICTED: sodium/potassium-transporting ATPase subunit beta-like [Rhagoletis zephyria]KAH9398598.1 Atp1b1p [Tyrophagus putrescentiae]
MANKSDKYSEKTNGGQSFGQFIWNPSTKEFLGRTGGSWFKITVFYIIFYLCLAAFWALMLLIFYQTLDERVPKFQLSDSRIGANPGLGFRPRPRDENIDSTLIWFKNGKESSEWGYWSKSLEDFLRPYSQSNLDAGSHVEQCAGNKAPEAGKFCYFDIKLIDNNCTVERNFGYDRGQPCVLIKLNRIFNWKPEPYNSEDLLDKNIPEVVKKGYGEGKNEVVYITCEGENAADKENIGHISYYPQQGIDFKYFPFTNQPGYLSPFVFVHFSRPQSGVLINVECKAWARNIKHNRMDREGSVHFEILMDGF